MLVSAVQQSELALCVCASPLFGFPSNINLTIILHHAFCIVYFSSSALPSPVYEWGNWSTGRLNVLWKATQSCEVLGRGCQGQTWDGPWPKWQWWRQQAHGASKDVQALFSVHPIHCGKLGHGKSDQLPQGHLALVKGRARTWPGSFVLSLFPSTLP